MLKIGWQILCMELFTSKVGETRKFRRFLVYVRVCKSELLLEQFDGTTVLYCLALLLWWWCYPTPSKGWGVEELHGANSRATPQGLNQIKNGRSAKEVAPERLRCGTIQVVG